MPTTHPRVNVVLEQPLYRSVSKLAKRDGVSLSLKVRDLVREALELQEDAYWVRVATSRRRTFNPANALSHGDVWKKIR
jgi:hypothetical protein